MILLDGVSKQFHIGKTEQQKQVLSEISLHIPKGEVVGIIGKSGAGKTTLLKLICGLLLPDRGRVRVLGFNPVTKRKQLAARLGVLFSDKTVLSKDDTVISNLDILINTYQQKRNGYQSDTKSLIKVFGLEELLHVKVKDLSLGQKRRVELVGLFLLQTELILMDEPCIGLDAAVKEQFEAKVKELSEQGKTIIISSHNMGEIDAICTRILLLEEGKLFFYGDKHQLYHQYAPIDIMTVKCFDKLPNMQDLPILHYDIDGLQLSIAYNTNHITAAEILKVLMQSTCIKEVNIKKPSLEDVIFAIGRK